MDSYSNDSCDTDGLNILTLLGKKHVLSILKVLGYANKPLRYQEISNLLKINTRTLTERLKELEKYNIIQRVSYNIIPPKVEYSLSNIAYDLKFILDALFSLEKKILSNQTEVKTILPS